MDRETIFVDTWGWMALGHRLDPPPKPLLQLQRRLIRRATEIEYSQYGHGCIDGVPCRSFTRHRMAAQSAAMAPNAPTMGRYGAATFSSSSSAALVHMPPTSLAATVG